MITKDWFLANTPPITRVQQIGGVFLIYTTNEMEAPAKLAKRNCDTDLIGWLQENAR